MKLIASYKRLITTILDQNNGVSREFFIANGLSVLFILIWKLFNLFGFSTSLIWQRLFITAVSVGVAYGVEAGVLLLVSGIFKNSLKNEFQDDYLADSTKVLCLIIFSYLILSNSSAAQELLTRTVYFLSFTVYLIIGYVSIALDKEQIGNLSRTKFIFFYVGSYVVSGYAFDNNWCSGGLCGSTIPSGLCTNFLCSFYHVSPRLVLSSQIELFRNYAISL